MMNGALACNMQSEAIFVIKKEELSKGLSLEFQKSILLGLRMNGRSSICLFSHSINAHAR